MAITVKMVWDNFDISYDDMKKLVGSSKFDNNTTIPLNRFVAYRGSCAGDISVFVAEKEGKNYVDMLPDKEGNRVSQAAGLAQNEKSDKKDKAKTNVIPMDISIFNIKENMG